MMNVKWFSLRLGILLILPNVVSTDASSQFHYYTSPRFPLDIVVGLPVDEGSKARNPFMLTIAKSQPVFDVAIEDVTKRHELLPTGALRVTYENTELSDSVGPQRVVDHYCNRTVDAVMGIAYVYALAPVARMSTFWYGGVPVFTTTAMVDELGDRKNFPLLTRMMGSYRTLGYLVREITKTFRWHHFYFLFNDEAVHGGGVGRSECYFSLSTIKNLVQKEKDIIWNVKMFSEFTSTRTTYRQMLKDASQLTNLIILCASPDTVREIMLAAHELGMATSGDYVFINIDVSTGSHAERPWTRTNETNFEENEKAKEAYQALKTISLRRSDLDEYKNFETRVKERAESKYNYSSKTGKEYEMNNFISAFYDAVLLYAIALNETIAAGMDPRNGHNITSKMWGRTFVGITGNVSIDSNGDRYSDYSLLDLDQKLGKFVEVAYYSGAKNELKKVGDFHWVGGKPPRDSPICGYDNSKCPKGFPLHYYLLAGSLGIIMFLLIFFLVFWRRYKLEQELAAMSWKIRWEELDGEDQQKKEKRRSKKSKRNDGSYPESEALLRSNSRSSANSDKRSSSSGATRKISAMIDRKLSIFTRKKSSPNSDKNGGIGSNHVDTLREVEDGECAPLNNEVHFRLPSIGEGNRRISSPTALSEHRQKLSQEEDNDLAAKKSISLKNRKLSFGAMSFRSGGSAETIAQNNGQIYTKTAVYKGTMVAIKKLNVDQKKYPKLDLSRVQLMELKKMKDLQHDHITRFTGACLDSPHYCIVTEYCPKGSLEDILENEKIELDQMMRYSLLHDLVKGMYFLHNSEIRSHGRLKSSNCVVDSRFVLKVTDFGLHNLHSLELDPTIEELGEHAYYKRMLWTSPELLRDSVPPPMGTQKGDVYSFAIILHEMLWRRGVFWSQNDDLTPKDIVTLVKKPVITDEESFRPYTPETPEEDEDLKGKELKSQTLIDLMNICWSEDPHERPEMSFIRKVVRGLNRDNETANLVDNLLKRMEQYANNLEGLVEERTQEYLAEKKKVEDLLHQLLPPSVADQLIAGRAVQAESYDQVTIYFSDIVGFTALSSQSTPLQVVTLLNDLYLAFDGVVDNFKVYKVETIGDAYMVVSGLPERREDHASQIAQMSLALLHKVKNFVIRHRPQEQLKLRIGMHSGSVVSGVVGSKMPRYCLFGDTVNTSSRMESNGLPLRIHVSRYTYDILTRDPGFRLDLRGDVEMKGKGKMTTYWLKGYRDIEIPDFGPEFRD
ncbi:unnamed protein product [Auanema sp. JU1783]|nr:unnamed protein product [Auanema sp. JU1783]